MKIEPIVSVIIPTYNYGHFIKSALESILRQTYQRDLFEIIVIDDGSTDGTYEKIKGYMDRIVYLYQENGGIACARNKGMSVARGEIITFLDADDEWYKDRIQKVVDKFIENPDAGLVYHPVELIDNSGVAIHKNFYRTFGYKEGISGWITNDIISGRVFCGGSSFAFRKDVMDMVFPLPEDIMRGVDFYITVICVKHSVCRNE